MDYKFDHQMSPSKSKGLYSNNPLDCVTNPEYKLICFIQQTFFCKEKKAQAFNQCVNATKLFSFVADNKA